MGHHPPASEMPFDSPALNMRLVAIVNFRGSRSPYSVVILQGVGTGSAYVKHPQIVCVYCISLSICLSVCLSKSLHVFVFLSLLLSKHMWCSPSRPGFTSLIPGISSPVPDKCD